MLDGGDAAAKSRPAPPAFAGREARCAPARPAAFANRRLHICTRSTSTDNVQGMSNRARTQYRNGEDPVRRPTTVEEMGAC